MKTVEGYAIDVSKSVLLKDGSVIADLVPTSLFNGGYEARFKSKEVEAEWHSFCGELSSSEVFEILTSEVL